MSMMGSTVPFARTAAERAAKGDPRPSIAERYGSRDRYLTLVREAATRLVTARHALAEDVDAMVSRAGALWDFVHSSS
jgi:alpha/beta hydrolase family protein